MSAATQEARVSVDHSDSATSASVIPSHGQKWDARVYVLSQALAMRIHLLVHLRAHLGDSEPKSITACSRPLPRSKAAVRDRIVLRSHPDVSVARARPICLAIPSQAGVREPLLAHRDHYV